MDEPRLLERQARLVAQRPQAQWKAAAPKTRVAAGPPPARLGGDALRARRAPRAAAAAGRHSGHPVASLAASFPALRAALKPDPKRPEPRRARAMGPALLRDRWSGR